MIVIVFWLASNLTFRRLVWNVLCGYILLQKKEIQDPNCPNLDTQKNQLPPLSNTWSLGNHFNQVYCAEGYFFLREKNRSILGRYSESRHPQIHLLLNPLAVCRNVLQGLEACIEGGQTGKIKDSRIVFESYCHLPWVQLRGVQSSSWQQIDETTKMWTHKAV